MTFSGWSRPTGKRRFCAAKAWLPRPASASSRPSCKFAPPGARRTAATDLTRAFSLWFMAVNTAEQAHRVRRRREYLSNSGTAQPGGIADCIARLQRDGLSLPQALELIGTMSIEPVFTAHPTESTRRTILRKQQHIADDLLERQNPTSTRAELDTRWARVRLQITSIWQTEEHPREGLTVVDQREHVLFYLIDILYRVVPLFYEEIEAALANAYAVPVEELDVPNILRFGSWVGGDMDGNEDVHGKTIRETLRRHQQLIVSTYFRECGQLAESLSQSANRVTISGPLAARIASYGAVLPGAQALVPARHDRMPYRVFFGQISDRLQASYEGRPNAYQNLDEFLADIELAADSLLENRGRHAGYFLVRRLLRRVRTFGFHLATLDVIQHARVHDEVIAQGLSQPGWPALPAAERLQRLRQLLDRDQGPTAAFDAVGRRSLWVFQAIAEARHKFGGRAVGEYIVSGARGPEDILAVLLLARWADITNKRSGECPLDVAPLLESIDTLESAGEMLLALHAEPSYRRHLEWRDNRQIVVIGYSDTNKQGGIAASRWALQLAQTRLLEAARAAGIRLLIFHGRGGTPARGGGRTEHLVESMPSGSVRGVLRLTEQGEVVNQSYGLRPIAMRTLERTFASVALATAHGAGPPIAPEQAAAMQSIAAHSLEAYRKLVFGSREFVEYFRAATPLDVIERMHIAARPAARADGTGIEALRAIPWVFAWTQSRHMLPGWFGFGSGLADGLRSARRRTHRPHGCAVAVLRTLVRRCGGHAGAHRSGNRRPLRRTGGRCAARASRAHPPRIRADGASCAASARFRQPARQRSDAAAIDQAAQSLCGSDAPHAGGSAAALAGHGAPGPGIIRRVARHHQRHRAGFAGYRLALNTRAR